MRLKSQLRILTLILAFLPALGNDRFELLNVFDLEFASDPQISPDGSRVIYVRNFMDIMNDVGRSNLWIIDADGRNHRALTGGNQNHSSPRWSPDGPMLVYVSNEDGTRQLYLRWMDPGQTAKLTNLTSPLSGISWSPDGKRIAFSMLVPEKTQPFVNLPQPPAGAVWAEAAKVIDRVEYRADGQGYLPYGYWHLFVIPREGGTPRQLTSGKYHHRGEPVWNLDGTSLLFTANRHENWEYDPRNTEVYEVSLKDGRIRALTD